MAHVTSKSIDERLARLRQFEMARDQYRAGGVSEQTNSMHLVLKLERELIRLHCEAHGLDKPAGVSAG